MKYLFSRCAFLAAFFSLLLTSCDEHEAIDLGIHPGHILCDDGTVVSDQSLDLTHKIPVAVIFTEQQGEGDGSYFMAVSLTELPRLEFCDSTSMVQGTNTEMNALRGDINTIAMQNSYDEKFGHGSPLADYVFGRHICGQSQFIPSVRELKMLYYQKEKVNSVLRRLNERIEGSADVLCTEALSDSCWYWSSTEVAANPSKQAWLFSMSSGTPHETPKVEAHAARSIVYYYPFQ